MTTDWKAIALALEKHQNHLDKAYIVVLLLKEQISEKSISSELHRYTSKMLELERDIRVTKNRINTFLERHCKTGKITKKWLSRRDSISDQFLFVSNKIPLVCNKAIQFIALIDSEKDD